MIELKPVDGDNVWDIVELSVQDDQQNYVATNTDSILEAYTTGIAGQIALPFGIYNDNELVGFVMFGFDTDGSVDDPEVAVGNYCIWRFMIDKRYQGKGLGKKAVGASLDYLRTWPCGPADFCWLSYEPENEGAKALYQALGFRENGEVCGGEIVAVLDL